jgi:hypothetical protein
LEREIEVGGRRAIEEGRLDLTRHGISGKHGLSRRTYGNGIGRLREVLDLDIAEFHVIAGTADRKEVRAGSKVLPGQFGLEETSVVRAHVHLLIRSPRARAEWLDDAGAVERHGYGLGGLSTTRAVLDQTEQLGRVCRAVQRPVGHQIGHGLRLLGTVPHFPNRTHAVQRKRHHGRERSPVAHAQHAGPGRSADRQTGDALRIGLRGLGFETHRHSGERTAVGASIHGPDQKVLLVRHGIDGRIRHLEVHPGVAAIGRQDVHEIPARLERGRQGEIVASIALEQTARRLERLGLGVGAVRVAAAAGLGGEEGDLVISAQKTLGLVHRERIAHEADICRDAIRERHRHDRLLAHGHGKTTKLRLHADIGTAATRRFRLETDDRVGIQLPIASGDGEALAQARGVQLPVRERLGRQEDEGAAMGLEPSVNLGLDAEECRRVFPTGRGHHEFDRGRNRHERRAVARRRREHAEHILGLDGPGEFLGANRTVVRLHVGGQGDAVRRPRRERRLRRDTERSGASGRHVHRHRLAAGRRKHTEVLRDLGRGDVDARRQRKRRGRIDARTVARFRRDAKRIARRGFRDQQAGRSLGRGSERKE